MADDSRRFTTEHRRRRRRSADDRPTDSGAQIRPDPGDRPHHGEHHRRRHLQPADVARRLRADHAGLDGSDDRRGARAGVAVRRTLPASSGRWWPVRVRARRLRQQVGLRERVVVLDHGVGRERRHRRRLGALRRALHQQGSHRAGFDPAGTGRPVAPGGHQPLGRQEHGIGPGAHDDPQVRRPRVHVDRRPVLHPERQLLALERERREHHRRHRRRHGDRAVQLPGCRDGVGRGGQGPGPRPQHPAERPSSAPWPPPSSTCCR